MTDEQMRIAIAEACGWKVINDTLCNVKPDKNGDPEIEFIAPLPDYLNDLNACAEFEAMLTDKEWNIYSAEIVSLPLWNRTTDTVKHIPQATARQRCINFARQRCIAFLKTKGIIP